ncbi:MAG: hypothetical protein P8N56_02110 [Schleiferiaceae bacterium]|nr:hypothetical protein [Schleiferiaceae bacterium]
MKNVFAFILLVLGVALMGQTRLPDGSLEDTQLEIVLLEETIQEDGALSLCIAKGDNCIENLTVGFTIRVYDSAGKEIWNSVWSGRTMDIQFKNPLPKAHKIFVEASGDFVINTTTANRISTRQPLKLTYLLNETSGR